jgi:type IV pilus assembly protein PilB
VAFKGGTEKSIGSQLVKRGVINEAQLKEVLEKQKLSGKIFGEVLVSLEYATEEQVCEALSEQIDIPFVDVSTHPVEEKVVKIFPESFLREHLALPLFKISESVTVVMADPVNIRIVDRLRFISRCEIEPLLGSASAIKQALDKYFGQAGSSEGTMLDIQLQGSAKRQLTRSTSQGARSPSITRKSGSAGTASREEQVAGLVAAAENAPVVKLVDSIIEKAVENRASDIHIEPEEDKTFVRYRIDGVLYDVPPPPKHLEPAVISRIKIMGNMDIAERRLPQDGRVQMSCKGKDVDLRVSSFPTIYGENLALRVLDKSTVILKLEDLGFDKQNLSRFSELLDRPHGIILVTGPTGCGKTTTLYAALRTLNAVEQNIITLEDPVEYRIKRVRQCQVDAKAGLTFATGLRSILRQDPDVVLIGEIRDVETAEIAVHAALTGHLVFSTLHTNDAAGALTRLSDMGVEQFLIASSVIGILAQRLVRTVCPKCRKAYQASPEILKDLGLSEKKDLSLYRAPGCEECKKTGYLGRTGVHEFLKVSDPMRELIIKKRSSAELRDQAIKEGMVTLRQSGIEKILKGKTSVEEILRITEHNLELS